MVFISHMKDKTKQEAARFGFHHVHESQNEARSREIWFSSRTCGTKLSEKLREMVFITYMKAKTKQEAARFGFHQVHEGQN
ncbi:hypothetical protein E2K98_20110 [Bacillus salipaludis]|uniref:Uncharacterized protein n=1 Tax=Bacillus salipaludis TaxID=2547811 RepID=A0A4R5VM04_9BACI|nr:hypothetical protein [Bacillus salipaludis]MDQ6596222.1 hypothetical protein [Bacillus salipaludis]TDK59019.1 hypothetical protein E2K98_20110 [Bacillus salipaludis]